MSKFWTAVALITGVALFLLVIDRGGREQVNFYDLETECRYDRGETLEIDKLEDSIRFEGSFPVNSTNANLDYSYSQTGYRVELNIEAPDTGSAGARDTCRGIAVYEAETGRLQPGVYVIQVRHGGRLAGEQAVEIK